MLSHLPQSGGSDLSVQSEADHPATLASRRVKMPPKKRIKVEDVTPPIPPVALTVSVTTSNEIEEVKEKDVNMEEVKESTPVLASGSEPPRDDPPHKDHRVHYEESASDDGEREAASTQTEDDSVNTSTSPSQMEQAAENRKRRFVPYWSILFPWVEYSKETDSMFCKPCSHAGRDNSYTGNGCRNFRKSSLMDHMITHDHKSAVEAEEKAAAARAYSAVESSVSSPKREAPGPSAVSSQSRGDRNAIFQVLDSTDNSEKERGIHVAMKSVEWLAREGLPLEKLPALLRLLENLGIPHVELLLRSEGREQSCAAENGGSPSPPIVQLVQTRNESEG